MSDDKTNVGGADRKRINVNEDYELKYWTMARDVSEQKLREGVKAVGPMAEDVRRHLGKK